MQEKTRITIRTDKVTARRLKLMAAAVERSQGDLLTALLDLSADGTVTPEEISAASCEVVRYLTTPMSIGK